MSALFRLFVVGILAFTAGFFLFVSNLPREGRFDLQGAFAELGDHDRQKVGIVVFTGGGGERIKRALGLYEAGKADRILISGTHKDVRKEDLVVTGDPTIIDCCVDLGFQAKTTIGNAREARNWASDHQYDAVILVTSEFHLPRAAVELHYAAPDLVVVNVPVASHLAPEEGWLTSKQSWNILGREYIKFLLAYARSLT